MKSLLRFTLLVINFLHFSFSSAHAQSSSEKENMKKIDSPAWIKMMDDPKTNYYEAVKSFEDYWKDHVKPAGEEQELSEGTKSAGERKRESNRIVKQDANKSLTSAELKAKNEEELLKYQVKRFEQWMREVKPFVQDDGRILTDEERMNIWKKQQEEINNQKK